MMEIFSTTTQSVIDAVTQALASSDGPVTVAIDGMCAGGKTTLAAALGEKFDCNVFHMDDFFLPPELRREERLREAGGNVHYERFRAEVLDGIQSNLPFSYGVFNCTKMAIDRQVRVVPKRLSLVEGSYSCHPYFGDCYALRIFVKVSPACQMERILRRNGAAMAEKFRTQWIPMENRYFSAFSIEQHSDLIFAT